MRKEKVFRMPYLTNLVEAKELASAVEKMVADFVAERPDWIWAGYYRNWRECEKVAIINNRDRRIYDCDFIDISLTGVAVREWVLSIALEHCVHPYALAEEVEGMFVDLRFVVYSDEALIIPGIEISCDVLVFEPNKRNEFNDEYSTVLEIRATRPEGKRVGQLEKDTLESIANAEANRQNVVKDTYKGEATYCYKWEVASHRKFLDIIDSL